MIRLCEVCFHEIGDDERFEAVQAVSRASADGQPVWRELYVHVYDPVARRCAAEKRADHRRR